MQKIFITTGGTGGHIIPARALAENLSTKYKTYLLADKKYRSYIDEEDGFRSYIIPSSQITKSIFKLIPASIKIGLGVLKSIFLILIHRPKYVFAFGGYATFPVLIASVITRRKIILHEQNAHLGKVHRIFLKYSNKLALTFEETDAIPEIYKNKITITGNPVRKEILELNKKQYQLPKKAEVKKRDKMGYKNIILASEFEDIEEAEAKNKKFNILILGGSGGARIFSEILPKVFFNLAGNIKNEIEIIQQCRKDLAQKTFDLYEEFNLNIEIDYFFHDIDRKIDDAHLIIARSGSSSINEFLIAKKPMILVPFANSADDHQLKNAKILEKSGSAIIIEEKDFDIQNFSKILTNLLKNQDKLVELSRNCEKLIKLDSVEKLTELLTDHK